MAAVNVQDGVSDDFDYEHWAPITKTRLVEDEVWDVVQSGVSPNPTKNPELAATIKSLDLALWRNRANKDNKALKIMQSSLPDSVFRKTISVASAKDLWDLLYQGNGTKEAKLRRLEKQLDNLTMDEEEHMDLYLKRVSKMIDRFYYLGTSPSDDKLVAKLIASLPETYEDCIPLLEEFMTLPDLTSRDLLHVFEHYGDDPRTMPQELQKFIDFLRKAWAEEMWCDVCQKDNHNQEDCYYNPRVVNSGGGQCGGRGNHARVSSNTRNVQAAGTQQAQMRIQKPEHLMLALNVGGLTYDENMWLVHTSTTNHMTPYDKFFTTLDRSYRARVGLVDGRVIMTEGKGDVVIMTKEGKKRIRNVLFVPGINKNVLSVSQMTADEGGSVTMGGGRCIIKNQAGKVFGEGNLDEKRGFIMRLQVTKEGRQ
ncbi:uncharacterized protein LOC111831580 [Capsella rubella]|uniref:uncharacterized protein LOC111831580 n=1 Tax=Capsella rubella TaxID=81985 RepID=UPI000CD56BC0|nr:uncharacterized protein LOC111831580 [Capsella rubella]